MIIVKVNDLIINMDCVQAVELMGTKIEFSLQDNEHCYTACFTSERNAKESFNKLFNDLVEAKGVDGAILSGDYT